MGRENETSSLFCTAIVVISICGKGLSPGVISYGTYNDTHTNRILLAQKHLKTAAWRLAPKIVERQIIRTPLAAAEAARECPELATLCKVGAVLCPCECEGVLKSYVTPPANPLRCRADPRRECYAETIDLEIDCILPPAFHSFASTLPTHSRNFKIHPTLLGLHHHAPRYQRSVGGANHRSLLAV